MTNLRNGLNFGWVGIHETILMKFATSASNCFLSDSERTAAAFSGSERDLSEWTEGKLVYVSCYKEANKKVRVYDLVLVEASHNMKTSFHSQHIHVVDRHLVWENANMRKSDGHSKIRKSLWWHSSLRTLIYVLQNQIVNRMRQIRTKKYD